METFAVDRALAGLFAGNYSAAGSILGILHLRCFSLCCEHGIFIEIGLHLPDEYDNEDACDDEESQIQSGQREVADYRIVRDASEPAPERYPMCRRACEEIE